jgi:hypothetical protein
MKVGDLVIWTGYPEASPEGVSMTGPDSPGAIVEVYHYGKPSHPRVDVIWGDGSFGERLYPQTIRVINKE